MTSFHSALVEFLSRLLKVAISWLPAPAPGPPFEPALEDVIEHAHPLGAPDRMVHPGRQVHDAGAHMDPLGGVGQVPHDHLGRRHVAVLGQRVVLAHPGVLPVVLVGLDHVGHLPLEHLVLALGIVRRLAGQIAVEKDSELHRVTLLSLGTGAVSR
jgi:hypothetical protein